jgi:hypothetical protein
MIPGFFISLRSTEKALSASSLDAPLRTGRISLPALKVKKGTERALMRHVQRCAWLFMALRSNENAFKSIEFGRTATYWQNFLSSFKAQKELRLSPAMLLASCLLPYVELSKLSQHELGRTATHWKKFVFPPR